jgi:PAS domain S-box-containing protein
MNKELPSLSYENRIKYLVEMTSAGALVYLILPLYVWAVGFSGTEEVLLALGTAILSLLRFTWSKLIKNRQSSLYEKGLYLISGTLALLASFLAAHCLGAEVRRDSLLFSTIFIATMTSGIMAAFSAVPGLAGILGGVMLFPYALGLAQNSESTQWWIAIGGILFHAWNMLQVRRTYQSYIKLQESERKISFQEERLREFINSIPGFVSWFDNELKYLDTNTRYEELSGLNRQEIIGKNLVFTDSREVLANKIREFKNSNIPHEMVELTFVVDGQDKYFLTSLSRYRLDSHEEQISVLSLDVSNLKSHEKELDRRRIHLMTQEKFAALGEMAGGIAHEINNPLAIICGKADVLLMQKNNGSLTPENLDRQLRGITSTSQRIIRIVKSLRTLVRDGRIDNIENTSVAAAVEPLLDIISSRIENQGVNLIVDRENFDVNIRCGIVELGQALMNLIINSAQAVEAYEDKWVKVQVKVVGEKINILISDSGTGISAEVQKKLFQPFFTTKAPGVGTGMGLSLSKELMQKQQGDLYYKPWQPNTTFVLELPLAKDPLQDSSNPAA